MMNLLVVLTVALLLVSGCVFCQNGPISDVNDQMMVHSSGTGGERGLSFGPGTGSRSGFEDVVIDYILNKQAYERLKNGDAKAPFGKRTNYRVCSVNLVSCFGRRK